MDAGVGGAKEAVNLEDRPELSSGIKTATLFQIYYRPEHLDHLYSFATPYFNYSLTIFFENSVIRDLVLASESKNIGVCSWKISHPRQTKLNYNLAPPRRVNEITEEAINRDYDVLPFTRNSKYHNMLAAASTWHPNFKVILTEILDYLQINMPEEVKTPIYQNAFMAKREIYQDYVKKYLSPVMDLMVTDPKINKLIMQDSGYTKLAREDAASPEYLREKIGIPFYPMAPFLLERLFSIYVHNENIKVTFL